MVSDHILYYSVDFSVSVTKWVNHHCLLFIQIMLTLPEENNNGLIIESNEDFQLVDEDMDNSTHYKYIY